VRPINLVGLHSWPKKKERRRRVRCGDFSLSGPADEAGLQIASTTKPARGRRTSAGGWAPVTLEEFGDFECGPCRDDIEMAPDAKR
jgi:hypothetical protein